MRAGRAPVEPASLVADGETRQGGLHRASRSRKRKPPTEGGAPKRRRTCGTAARWTVRGWSGPGGCGRAGARGRSERTFGGSYGAVALFDSRSSDYGGATEAGRKLNSPTSNVTFSTSNVQHPTAKSEGQVKSDVVVESTYPSASHPALKANSTPVGPGTGRLAAAKPRGAHETNLRRDNVPPHDPHHPPRRLAAVSRPPRRATGGRNAMCIGSTRPGPRTRRSDAHVNAAATRPLTTDHRLLTTTDSAP